MVCLINWAKEMMHMPRPRHDSELLPAKERMRNAFWALLEDREYRKITVTDIVAVILFGSACGGRKGARNGGRKNGKRCGG